jgi:hypothetical protein
LAVICGSTIDCALRQEGETHDKPGQSEARGGLKYKCKHDALQMSKKGMNVNSKYEQNVVTGCTSVAAWKTEMSSEFIKAEFIRERNAVKKCNQKLI